MIHDTSISQSKAYYELCFMKYFSSSDLWEAVIWCVRRGSREIRLNIDGVDIRNSSKVKNIDSRYIRVRLWERFAHLSYMHQESAVSAMTLLAHLSQMHRGPTVAATELFKRVSHMPQIPVVAATELPIGIPQMHYSSLVSARQRLTSPISTLSMFSWISRDTLRLHQIEVGNSSSAISRKRFKVYRDFYADHFNKKKIFWD